MGLKESTESRGGIASRASTLPKALTAYNRHSRQLRAVALKTISYQKRQMFTNISCISLCPMLMILISWGLGVLIQSLFTDFKRLEETLFCSNVSDYYNLNYSYAQIPLRKNAIKHTFNPPSAYLPNSCVYYFGTPFYSPPWNNYTNYEPRDSTYWGQPRGGWLEKDLLNFSDSFEQDKLNRLLLIQKKPFVYIASKSQLKSLIGQDSIVEKFNILEFSSLNQSSVFKDILSAIPFRYYLNVSSVQVNLDKLEFIKVPYFKYFNSDKMSDIDDFLSEVILQVIEKINQVDKIAIVRDNSSTSSLSEYYISSALATKDMPYGVLYFSKIDYSKLDFSYTLIFGSDERIISGAWNFPYQGLRQIIMQAQLTNAILKNSKPEWKDLEISQGLRMFPILGNNYFELPIGSLIGRIVYPFGVSFLLPIFVVILVKEKEDRIQIMTKMNGLNTFVYYLAHYVHFLILHILSSAFFLLTGYLVDLELFKFTSWSVLAILWLTWGHSQISTAFFLSIFYDKSGLALVVTFLFTLTGIIVSAAVDLIFVSSSPPLAYMLWPPFAFYRCLSVLNAAAVGGLGQNLFGLTGGGSDADPYILSRLKPENEVFNGIMMMWGCSVFYLLLTAYLYQVLPSKYGIQKKWYFPILWIRDRFRKNDDEKYIPNFMPPQNTHGDGDVKEERQKINSGEFPDNCPLIIKDLQKSFGEKKALNGISFMIEKGLVFGLLGENGAGKTTLISILSGLFTSDSGTAILTGYDTSTQMTHIHQRIGICPQYDIHWEDLTIHEHLLFYARLKDISKKDEDECVSRALADVGLTGMGHRRAKALSGGEKRRLSIAMALIGDPVFVFLDEPTTGLDPQVRRIIWKIIQESRRKQTFLLTTHSMEEAEILCQRIGIMSHGNLECIGSPLHLKNLYGTGFNLSIKYSNKERALNFLNPLLTKHCKSWKFSGDFNTGVTIELIPLTKSSLGDFCQALEDQKDAHDIDHWGISQKSMEQVFINILSKK